MTWRSIAEGTVMAAYLRPSIFSKTRSRLAFWTICCALGGGVLLWFLYVNRAPVVLHLPFGQGQWNSSLALVVLGSMALGSGFTLAIQAISSARRKLKKLYQAWNRPRTDAAHRYEQPHIVSHREQTSPRLAAKIEYSGHSD